MHSTTTTHRWVSTVQRDLQKEIHCFLEPSNTNSLPNQGESLLLRHVINTNFTQFFRRNTLARLEQIYLQSHFNLLREGALREDGLDLRHDGARDHAALGSDGMDLLVDARDDGEVLREVVGDETTDAAAAKFIHLRNV